MSIDNKKVAEQFDAIAEACGALAQLFRNAGSTSTAKSGDAETKPKRTAKSKSVPDEEFSQDDVRTALKELMTLRGKDVMASALESVGAGKLPDVDESQYGELMAKIEELKAEEPEDAPAPKATAKRATKKKAGPTQDDVVEVFKKLIAEDKALATKVLKGLGVKKVSELDEEQFQDAIDAANAALEGDDEDDLI